ncbi:hypothetical protein SDJN03_06953, partial [Cucurbita argyrosperma subsp. sororia]
MQSQGAYHISPSRTTFHRRVHRRQRRWSQAGTHPTPTLTQQRFTDGSQITNLAGNQRIYSENRLRNAADGGACNPRHWQRFILGLVSSMCEMLPANESDLRPFEIVNLSNPFLQVAAVPFEGVRCGVLRHRHV